jgi:circadian clock protein KaiC
MVDGIFTFEDRLFRGKAERLVQVRKFRGSEVVRGQHSFCITNEGLKFFPRLESLPLQPKQRVSRNAVALGVRELDEALGEQGVWAGSMSLAIGESGVGKTLVAFRFAAVADDSAPGLLLLGSAETEADACALAARFGIDLDGAIERGALRIERIGQVDESLDEMGHKILRLVDEARAKRLILDGTAALADTLAFQDRGYRFLGRLLFELRRRDVTALFTVDPAEIAVASGTPLAMGVSALFDNVFALEARPGADVARQLTVAKIRGSLAKAAVFALRD